MRSAGHDDVFVVALGPGPQYRGALRFGGAGPDHATALAVAPDGRACVTGFFVQTANFGTPETWTGRGASDALLVEVVP